MSGRDAELGLIGLGTMGRNLLLNLADHGVPVAGYDRGGCIIRSALLEPIRAALARTPDLPHLLLDEDLGAAVAGRQAALRGLVRASAEAGLPAPAAMAALSHYDGLRSARLPANLIQTQRDAFGSHGYRRRDREGQFHADWTED